MEKRLRYLDYMYKFNIHTRLAISTGKDYPSCTGSVNAIDGSNILYAPCLYPSEDYRNSQIHHLFPFSSYVISNPHLEVRISQSNLMSKLHWEYHLIIEWLCTRNDSQREK